MFSVILRVISWVVGNGYAFVLAAFCGIVISNFLYQNFDLTLFAALSWVLFALGAVVALMLFVLQVRPKQAFDLVAEIFGEDIRQSPWAEKFFRSSGIDGKLVDFAANKFAQYLLITALVSTVGMYLTLIIADATRLQADRLREQNALMEEQIAESRNARFFNAYTAQLGPLLTEIDRLRSDSPENWSQSPELASRIQGIVDSLVPHKRHPTSTSAHLAYGGDQLSIPAFSPERAQFFRVLVSLGYDFSTTGLSLDFSHSDFSNLTISAPTFDVGGQVLDLGQTDLSGSSFLGTKFDQVRVAEADLSGSYFGRETDMHSLLLWGNSQSRLDGEFDTYDVGANLSGSTILEVIPESLVRRQFNSIIDPLTIEGGRFVVLPHPEAPHRKHLFEEASFASAGLIRLWINTGQETSFGSFDNAVRIGQADGLADLWRDRPEFELLVVRSWPSNPSCAAGRETRDVETSRDFFSAVFHQPIPEILYLFPTLYQNLSDKQQLCFLSELGPDRPFPETFQHLQ